MANNQKETDAENNRNGWPMREPRWWFSLSLLFAAGFLFTLSCLSMAFSQSVNECGKPVLSVDVPSGWHVEDGPLSSSFLFCLLGVCSCCLI